MSEWRDEMLKLLAKLTLKREAEFFKLPVEWEAMGLTDYITIIKKPMDLRTVRENLESGEYDTAPDASADVRSIFMNAMSYNKPNSRVYVHAKTMSEFWEASCAALMKGLVDPDKPASAEQLAAFVDKCHRVNAQELGVILKHLDEECPNCLVKRADSNEVEVNVDLMQAGPSAALPPHSARRRARQSEEVK
eukprot:CAMPEP_0173298012 /NCGR_PEP_ID=MMETSP1143-20121109/15855_1 /TAXON_ID=483371 /ORGANISM="non described non described, Strain CCMP2298" /LENGTH=191 /DNA_ID=CAMNT_0014238079 /DNA_START=108 /DNA_END=684 /DNA_ORIENTATION=+